MANFKHHDLLANPQDSVLLVIDVQDRLIGTIAKAEAVIINIAAMIKTAQIHQIPIVTTEQEKLGATVAPLKELLQEYGTYVPIAKKSFSCCPNPAFREALRSTNRKQLLITGTETHICVSQTVLDLLANDYRVHVVADAVSSHNRQDHKTALDRLSSQGSTNTATEALIYELTATAATPTFKQILGIVKDRRKSLAN